MKKPTWARSPQQLQDLSTHGVATRAQLREAKVSDSSLTARTAPGGPWQRLLPGVYLLHNGYPSPLQRSIAALAYGGPKSSITGQVGLGAHGYGTDGTSNEVHVLIPAGIRRASKSFVRVERTWRMPDAIEKGSLRVAPLVRSLADTTRAVKTDEHCVRLIAEVVQRGGATLDDIALELAEGPRRHGAISKRVVGELRDDAHSVAELQAQKLYADSGLPPMMHNCAIYTASGKLLCITDNLLDEVGFCWEIDSLAYHLTPADHAKTIARRTEMQGNGLIVLSHLPRDIRDNPAKVLADLRSHYQLALNRPRPSLTVRPWKDL
ncbi:hypothetical protein QMK17_13215 [Rhodococcus sp. G-MC3]|uniref:hypothetical protein n=1 Tax=Rhodococcus sp. G-MC3 TaxID=3046209 RepID=UPI0024BBCD0B|nr:hypothetical protein [Rhodococcus sp. G-MC3]MDJ0394286.1 hypothetical protein [Rhodococcus sp. G-MC3]